MNNDTAVNLSDLASLIGYLLNGDATGIDLDGADCSQDGNVNVADVSSLIDYLLTGAWPEVEEPHYYVDLGLPSGTLWATCNIGADRPEDYGAYFAWGETQAKGSYTMANYKWYNNDTHNITKYCLSSTYGPVDNKSELETGDDAAYVNWGPSWRMPTEEQWEEMLTNTTQYWYTYNGVNGDLVIGPNGNYIFFPGGGIFQNYEILFLTEWGFYWTRTIDPHRSNYALGYNLDCYYTYRSSGLMVRAVRVPQN